MVILTLFLQSGNFVSRRLFSPRRLYTFLQKSRYLMGGFFCLAGLALGTSLFTYSPFDPSFESASSLSVRNSLGVFGAYMADVLLRLFGASAYFAVLFFFAWGLQRWRRMWSTYATKKWLIFLLSLISLSLCLSTLPHGFFQTPFGDNLGGYLGLSLQAGLEFFSETASPSLKLMIEVLTALFFLGGFVGGFAYFLLCDWIPQTHLLTKAVAQNTEEPPPHNPELRNFFPAAPDISQTAGPSAITLTPQDTQKAIESLGIKGPLSENLSLKDSSVQHILPQAPQKDPVETGISPEGSSLPAEEEKSREFTPLEDPSQKLQISDPALDAAQAEAQAVLDAVEASQKELSEAREIPTILKTWSAPPHSLVPQDPDTDPPPSFDPRVVGNSSQSFLETEEEEDGGENRSPEEVAHTVLQEALMKGFESPMDPVSEKPPAVFRGEMTSPTLKTPHAAASYETSHRSLQQNAGENTENPLKAPHMAPVAPFNTAIPPAPTAPQPPLPQTPQPLGNISESSATPPAPSKDVIIAHLRPTTPLPERQEPRESFNPAAWSEKEAYRYPPLTLLGLPHDAEEPLLEEEKRDLVTNLEDTLRHFRIDGEVKGVRNGPLVTLLEYEPRPGIKTSKIVNLSEDIARAMSVASVRISVLAGTTYIGIEVPNKKQTAVGFPKLLQALPPAPETEGLTLTLGVTIDGIPVCEDITHMPHLLIAGTTGSGKSVAMNSFLLSLLMTHSPDECRLILIDPKQIEFVTYRDIPHLISPVITDMRQAAGALSWAVKEMEKRYSLMSEKGVRNILSYNKRLAQDANPEEKKLPFIVICIDEVADLMLTTEKNVVEGYIQRLAQKARAAGIHLLLATQRPSSDIITGAIKANFPSRISFSLTTSIDSRVILDSSGAESLLGRGDMLYMANGATLRRLHGPLVTDAQIDTLTGFWKAQGAPIYDESVMRPLQSSPESHDMEESSFENSMEDSEDFYKHVVAWVLQEEIPSVSSIQRHFSIGYNRAARLMDRMEKDGYMSPQSPTTGRRTVLKNG